MSGVCMSPGLLRTKPIHFAVLPNTGTRQSGLGASLQLAVHVLVFQNC